MRCYVLCFIKIGFLKYIMVARQPKSNDRIWSCKSRLLLCLLLFLFSDDCDRRSSNTAGHQLQELQMNQFKESFFSALLKKKKLLSSINIKCGREFLIHLSLPGFLGYKTQVIASDSSLQHHHLQPHGTGCADFSACLIGEAAFPGGALSHCVCSCCYLCLYLHLHMLWGVFHCTGRLSRFILWSAY